MFSLRKKKLDLPTADEALPGRAQRLSVPARHFVNGNRLEAPFPAAWSSQCSGWMFLGRRAQVLDDARVTARRWVTLAASLPIHVRGSVHRVHGHNEVVRVVFDPQRVSYTELLRIFWNRTTDQGMRQGATSHPVPFWHLRL